MNNIITIPFTEPFLGHLVEYIHAQYLRQGKDLRRLAIVFGGRRPALFVKRQLAQRIQGPFYPPRFFTIDEWMTHVAGAQARPLSDLEHAFVIYRLAQIHTPEILQGRAGFAQFLPWAREILRFIDHLDLENTPADALQVLREHAAIGFNVPDDINQLLQAIVVLRRAYHSHLSEQQLTSRGYQYLNAARGVAQYSGQEFDGIVFANFFYLHRTENAVIKNLYDRGKAILFMQGDERRWPALKRIAQTFGQPVVEGPHVKPTAFNLKLYAAFDMHAQAGLVCEILKKISDLNKTVIVLPEPDFILPLLSAISAQLEEFNISMGYPLKRSSLYALLVLMFTVQSSRKQGLYYSRDYLKVLRHPLVKNLSLTGDSAITRVVIHKIEEALTGDIATAISGHLFVRLEAIESDERLIDHILDALKAMDLSLDHRTVKNILVDVHRHFFSCWQDVQTCAAIAEVLNMFLDLMRRTSTMAQYPFNERIAERMQEIMAEFACAAFHNETFTADELFRIVQDRLGSELVAFSGSPVRGLQILGLLETRSLSFDQVIVVDVNEKVLPNLNIYEPLIPREVMIKMNLDRLELEEEIQRYQFMRLISSARDVHLIYQERTDKERSRFIEELIWEQEKKSGHLNAVPITRPGFTVAVSKQRKVIPKTPAVAAFLKNMTFSASSINMYLRNPYEFYLSYVLGLKEKDDLLDDPEGKHIGTFVHELLDETFKNFVHKKPVLDAVFHRHFFKVFEARFTKTFGDEMKSDAFLMKAVLETRLQRFVEQEAGRVEAEVEEILFIERKFENVIDLPCGPVRLTYRVDRVDRMKDGTIMILDYKTGGSDAIPKIAELAQSKLSRELIRDYAGSVQMPLYVHYLDRQYPQNSVNAALYHLRTMSMEKLLNGKALAQRSQYLGDFLKILDFVMAEIFNPEFPFIDDPLDIV